MYEASRFVGENFFMKKLCLHPLFFIGLVIRVALIIGIAPFAVSHWYVPFLDLSTSIATLNPWSEWIAHGGTSVAFPYGYAMWFTFLPITLVAKFIGLPLQYGYALTLLGVDFCLLLTLHKFLPKREHLLLVVYWLSPIVILASYGLGLNDLIPALFLVLAVFFIQRIKLKWAGLLCAIAISAKFSMIVSLPFFAIYLYNNKALRCRFSTFLSGFFLGAAIFGIPFLFSGDGLRMLLSNPEMGKVYQLKLDLGKNISVYVVPIAYMTILYLAWRVRRLNFDLFQAIIGMAFLLIVLMTPASPGWFIWAIPFLTCYQATSTRITIGLIGGFSGLYILSALLNTPLTFVNGIYFDLSNVLRVSEQLEHRAVSLLHTVMLGIGILLAIRIWREAIRRNDFFRLSRKPFVIGIAGDSGAGKDTFADSIAGLFGTHSVVKLTGDDYHLWDRQKPIWQVMTPLNPMANDLERFCNDLVALTNGRSIHTRYYDHSTGKMSKPIRIKNNDFIIVSGLHALYLPMLRECYHLTVFLDIDEKLRRQFKLRRDVQQRGHTVERVLSSLEKRKADSERFIRPQRRHTDLIFSLQPMHPGMLEKIDTDAHPIRLKLVATSRHAFNELSLNRVLVGICGLHVDIAVKNDSEIQMTIEGETSAADVALAARIVCPRIIEFLDLSPQWQDGMGGLMQLITLSHVAQALTKRFI